MRSGCKELDHGERPPLGEAPSRVLQHRQGDVEVLGRGKMVDPDRRRVAVCRLQDESRGERGSLIRVQLLWV